MPVLLIVLLVVSSLGIAADDLGTWGDSGVWTNDQDTARAARVVGKGDSGDLDPGVVAAGRHLTDRDCGPSVTCLPVLLPLGGLLLALAPGPDRNIYLPRHLVALWQPRPMAPVPIA